MHAKQKTKGYFASSNVPLHTEADVWITSVCSSIIKSSLKVCEKKVF